MMMKVNLACVIFAALIATFGDARQSSDNSDFVDFQTFEMDGEIEAMNWCGSNDETILVKTSDGTVYRSRDRGSNWKRLKSLMNKKGSAVADTTQEVSAAETRFD